MRTLRSFPGRLRTVVKGLGAPIHESVARSACAVPLLTSTLKRLPGKLGGISTRHPSRSPGVAIAARPACAKARATAVRWVWLGSRSAGGGGRTAVSVGAGAGAVIACVVPTSAFFAKGLPRSIRGGASGGTVGSEHATSATDARSAQAKRLAAEVRMLECANARLIWRR